MLHRRLAPQSIRRRAWQRVGVFRCTACSSRTEELIGLASLPFARQVTLGAGVEPLTKDRVEDHFRAFAERARREFAAAAERHDVKWSFESVRGPLAPDMLGGEHDFVVAGAASRPIGGHFRIASRCWSWMAIVAQPFLLASREWQTGGSVLTLLRRRDPKSVRVLDIAAQIAGFCNGRLTAQTPIPPGWLISLLGFRSVSRGIQ
jgi:hypothetical protein